MGLTFSTIFDSLASLTRWRKDQDVRILMIGLDAAGKTTILYQLHVCSMPLRASGFYLFERSIAAWGGRIYNSEWAPSIPLHDLPTGCLTRHQKAIGFNVETVVYKNIKLVLWDLGVSLVHACSYYIRFLNNITLGTK